MSNIIIETKNIKIGDVFSTLTKLYGALELPNVKGKQKQVQDKEIARHLKYELTGTNKRCKNEIVITEIYNIPLEKVDGRSNNKGAAIRMRESQYDTYMQDIIMDALESCGTIQDTYYNVINDILCLTGETFQDATMNGINGLITSNEIGKGVCLNYLYKMKNIIQSDYNKAIRNLTKQNYIEYQKGIKIVRSGDNQAEVEEDDEVVANIMMTEKWAYDEMEIKPNQRMDSDINKKFKKFVVKNLDDDMIYNYWKIECIYTGKEYDNYNFRSEEEIELFQRKLIELYMTEVHRKVLNIKLENDYGVFHKAYSTDDGILGMMKLDKLMWSYDDIRDYTNEDFTTRIFNEIGYYTVVKKQSIVDEGIPF